MRTPSSTLAVLWDESHLWGLLLHRALQAMGAPVAYHFTTRPEFGILGDNGATPTIPNRPSSARATSSTPATTSAPTRTSSE